MNVIKQFNLIVEDLLKQTTYLLGNKYLFNFKTLIQFNAVQPIEKFTIFLYPYKDHIMNKDIDFFINSDIEFSGYNNININDIIDLKKIFKNIDDESKDNIWEILQALVLLCEEKYKSKSASTKKKNSISSYLFA
jgi:hypothetical protein